MTNLGYFRTLLAETIAQFPTWSCKVCAHKDITNCAGTNMMNL